MYSRTPRLVKAVYRKEGVIIVTNCTKCREVTTGWETLVRTGHYVLHSVVLTARRVMNDVHLWSPEMRGVQTYLIGDWLTNSNSVRRSGHSQRKLVTSSWAAWLVRAWSSKNWLCRFAVLWTIGRFIHVDRRRGKGMIPTCPLYNHFPLFLNLYDTLPPLSAIQAFIQMADEHFWTTESAWAAESAIVQSHSEAMFPEVMQLVEEAVESSGRRHSLATSFNGIPGHCFVYEFILACGDKELASIVFSGVSVKRKLNRPRHVHGHWRGHKTTGVYEDKLFCLLHWLEFNSFLPRTERYLCDFDAVTYATQGRHAKTRSFWVTRKLKEEICVGS